MLEAVLIIGSYALCLGLGVVFIVRSVKTHGRGQLWTGLALIFSPLWLLLLYLMGTEILDSGDKLVLTLVAAYAVCALLSAVYFRRFLKTQSRRSLWTGLSLLFGPPGVLILYIAVIAFLQDETPQQPAVMCYMPSHGGGAIIQPQTDEDKERWGGLEKKYGARVSTGTFHKLSGGVFDEMPSNVDKSVGGK